MPVPVDVQFSLFSKILTFDRNLPARVNDSLVVGLVYQKKFRGSLIVKNKAVEATPSLKKMGGFNSRCVEIDISDAADLAKAISKNGVDILYIAPLRAVEMEKIAAASRARQTMTLTGVPEYVESGLAVGIGMQGGKPRIIINLPAAKAEGVDFDSRLLKLAKILK